MDFQDVISPPEDIIELARNGHMVILVDDEDRENEGDLVIPAQMATPEVINFMAKHARGLICLAMAQQRVDELGLPLMPRLHSSRLQTAFTVSIEAREGVSTGISASDRARTIATAIDPARGRNDITTPGHVFPLVARDGGVLVRAGHTEAAVDIARLAGLNPSGVICEIMNDDGTMARRNDLIAFAQLHGLKIGTIADLIAYRRRYDRIVERSVACDFDSAFGGRFRMMVYTNRIAFSEHLALVKGDVTTAEPVLVRMHALNVLDDVLGNQSSSKTGALQESLRLIGEAGRGVVVLIREPLPSSLSSRVEDMCHGGDGGGSSGKAATELSAGCELRDYGIGAQILLDLGIKQMILLSNTKHNIVGLDGYELEVVDQRPIPQGGSGQPPAAAPGGKA